jgi:hypothetical protein
MTGGVTRCSSCDRETPAESAFGGNWGSSLHAACARCGVQLVSGMAFCISWGSAVADNNIPSRKCRIAERGRRAAALVLSPLRRSRRVHPLAEHTDPEDIRDLLGSEAQ